jgi:hypothetical protein
MTKQKSDSRPKRRGAITLIAALAAAVVIVVVFGVVSGATTAGHPAARGSSTSKPPRASSTPSAALPRPTATSRPSTGSTPPPTAAPVVAATPQPTRTAQLAVPAVIVRALIAHVTRIEAVQGVANGPGEIAGPALRFTIGITNSTGRAVDLSNTVVNAYSGPDGVPATQLESPGGVAFPRSVAAGHSAVGVFVFTVPEDQRSDVEVTVDTSVHNPVIAFRGDARR